jgi:hypothetical protein
LRLEIDMIHPHAVRISAKHSEKRLLRHLPRLAVGCVKLGRILYRGAEKRLQAVIPIRQPTERNLALSILNAVRHSSSSANKSGELLGMTGHARLSAAC